MVAVYDIINEAGSVGDFMLNAGDRIVHNGITAEWKGNQFQVTSMNATARDNYPDVRVNQPLPRKYRGGFVNALRASSGLQRIDFDGGGGVRGQINNTPVGVTPGNNDSRETEADSERRLRRRGAWAASKRAFQGTLGISLSLGLPLAAYSQLEQELKELHNLKYPIPPGEDGHDPQLWANPMSEEQYQIAAGRYFATWVGTFVVPALITILRKGRRAIMALLTPIRTMMAVFNALVLLLTEVGIYFAAQAIMRNENVRNALIKFVASYYGMQFAKAMDISYNVIGSAIVGAIDLATDDDDAVAAVKDAVDEFAATQGGAAPTVSDTEVGQGAAEVTPAAQGTGSGLDNVFD
jgi:hypothetical protein